MFSRRCRSSEKSESHNESLIHKKQTFRSPATTNSSFPSKSRLHRAQREVRTGIRISVPKLPARRKLIYQTLCRRGGLGTRDVSNSRHPSHRQARCKLRLRETGTCFPCDCIYSLELKPHLRTGQSFSLV